VVHDVDSLECDIVPRDDNTTASAGVSAADQEQIDSTLLDLQVSLGHKDKEGNVQPVVLLPASTVFLCNLPAHIASGWLRVESGGQASSTYYRYQYAALFETPTINAVEAQSIGNVWYSEGGYDVEIRGRGFGDNIPIVTLEYYDKLADIPSTRLQTPRLVVVSYTQAEDSAEDDVLRLSSFLPGQGRATLRLAVPGAEAERVTTQEITYAEAKLGNYTTRTFPTTGSGDGQHTLVINGTNLGVNNAENCVEIVSATRPGQECNPLFICKWDGN
jgi:hypothetical protein